MLHELCLDTVTAAIGTFNTIMFAILYLGVNMSFSLSISFLLGVFNKGNKH